MTGDDLAPEPIASPEALAGSLLVVAPSIALIQRAIGSEIISVFALIVMAIAGVGFAVLGGIGELRRIQQ